MERRQYSRDTITAFRYLERVSTRKKNLGRMGGSCFFQPYIYISICVYIYLHTHTQSCSGREWVSLRRDQFPITGGGVLTGWSNDQGRFWGFSKLLWRGMGEREPRRLSNFQSGDVRGPGRLPGTLSHSPPSWATALPRVRPPGGWLTCAPPAPPRGLRRETDAPRPFPAASGSCRAARAAGNSREDGR